MAVLILQDCKERSVCCGTNAKWLLSGHKFLGMLACLWAAIAVPVAADVVYCHPRPYNVTYIFELEPDPNKIDRTNDLKLWLPLPREWDSQKSVQILSIDPPPYGTYEEQEFGNRMAFWDFGKGPEKSVYTATIKFRLESYDIRVHVDPNKVGAYDKSSPEYQLYTRSENTIRLTPKIYELAKEAVGDEKNPYLQARRIAQYVYKKVHYKILQFERGRGIQSLLDYPVKDPNSGEEYYEGDCGQTSAMVVALCRAVGIPARCVSGYFGWPPRDDLRPIYPFETKLNPQGLAGAQTFGQLVTHVWTEFYIPNYGWIPDDFNFSWNPDDPSVLPFNCRTVWAKGGDFRIGPQCPEGENHGYGAQWVLLKDGRADGSFYAVWNIAKIHTARAKSLFEFDPFPADALVDYHNLYGADTQDQGTIRSGRQPLELEQFNYMIRPSPGLTAALQNRYFRFLRNACVCNVLKNIVGKDKFSQIVTEYERTRVNSGKAVPIAQFQQIAEAIYGQSLGWFFEPWMDENELPELKLDQVSLNKEDQGWCISGHLLQTGKLFYRLPVELALQTERGVESRTFWQEKRDAEFRLHTSQKPVRLVVDPNHEILKIERFPPHLIWRRWVGAWRGRIIYGTGAEMEANKAGAESLMQTSLRGGRQFIMADTEATPEDLDAQCLILIGRPEVNTITERLQDRFPIKFEGEKFTWQGKVYDQATQGVIAVVDEGRSSRRLTMLFAGLSAEATKDFSKINDWFDFLTTASYLIYDGNRCVVSGEWENADPDLVWLSGTQVTDAGVQQIKQSLRRPTTERDEVRPSTKSVNKPAESFDQAVLEGNIELVKSLLSQGADVNARDRRGQTVLHIAASNGHKVLVELLLAKGASIDAKGPAGGTALHGASRFGHRDVVELLIAKGADINARRYNWQTPLSVAKEQGHEDVVELLKKHGAKE